VDDTLNKLMPDNIALRQFDDADTLYAAQALNCLDQAAFLAMGEVCLRYVTGDYHFGAASEPGKNHKHLQCRCILCLIADYNRLIKSPAPHKSKRDNLNHVHIHKFSHLAEVHHIFEGVEQRAKIGIYFCLNVTGEKAELFACLDGGPGEDYASYLFSFEHRYSNGNRKIGLACPRGAYTKRKVIVEHRLDIFELSFAGWLDYFFVRVNGNRLGRLRVSGNDDIRKYAADVISSKKASSVQVSLHLVDYFRRPVDIIGFAGNEKIVLPGGHPDIEGITHHSKISIGRPEQFELFTTNRIELYCYLQEFLLVPQKQKEQIAERRRD
jgi:hypothetical protein